MYVPQHNRMEDRAQLLAFMRQYSFATLVSCAGGSPRATHLPFVVEEGQGGALRLVAHLARANPQWRGFDGRGEVLAIFQGPHAYVSPSHYQRHPSVPTWNYAAVHAAGSLRLLEGRDDKLAALRGLIGVNDPAFLATMDALPPDYLEQKLSGIVAFEIAVTHLEARWKLSQDRLPGERGVIVEALSAQGGAAAEVAEMMRRREAGHG
jgi:transcriptional regulator